MTMERDDATRGCTRIRDVARAELRYGCTRMCFVAVTLFQQSLG